MRSFQLALMLTTFALWAPGVWAAPAALSDAQLDRITAGSGGYDDPVEAAGGIIVANGSTAAKSSNASVSLGESAQMDARALSLVNSADALVGSGLNVWDGQLDTTGISSSTNVDQDNQVLQTDALRSAQLDEYVRGESSIRDVQTHAVSAESNIEFHLTWGDVAAEIVIPAEIIPPPKAPGTPGTGAALAGEIDVSVDGGNVLVDFDIDAGITNNTYLEANTTGNILGGLFGSLDGNSQLSNDLSAHFNPHLLIEVELPDVEIHANGAICYAKGGTCDASVYEEQRAPVSIASAEAEEIVVDHSELTVETVYAISLTDGAQAGARAVSLVNAAGGQVGIGANVARVQGGSLSTPLLNLAQSNVVVQGR